MNARLSMWSWRIREAVTPDKPKWLHLLMCQFCHGMSLYVRQQERSRRRQRAVAP